jgi:hypothetical protein
MDMPGMGSLASTLRASCSTLIRRRGVGEGMIDSLAAAGIQVYAGDPEDTDRLYAQLRGAADVTVAACQRPPRQQSRIYPRPANGASGNEDRSHSSCVGLSN